MDALIKTITERLYDGITSLDDWSAGLQALLAATDSVLFHHVAWDLQAQCVAGGVTNEVQRIDRVREYEEHHAANDPRVPLIMNMRVGELLLDHEHFTPHAMSSTPIYADWLASNGLRHSLGVSMFEDGHTREWLALMRPLDHCAYGDDARMLLQHLMPDLLRAARLRAQMADVAAQAALGQAALEALPQALALVDDSGQLRYANRTAQTVLADGHGWRVCHGRLCANSPAVQERLERGVKTACRRPARRVGGGGACGDAAPAASTLHMPRHGVSGTAASTLHVLPLHPGHPLARAHWERPHALLVWGSHAAKRMPDLAATLGLTDTEARLALTLAQGRSLKDFALAQGCTWHTARTHIKNLMRKLGLHRQQDVVALVQRLM